VFGQFARHALDMSTRIINAVDRCGKIDAGRVVDRVHPDRLRASLRAKRVDECLSDPSNTRWLVGAACEHHLDVRAGIRRRGRNPDRRDEQRRSRHHRSTNDTSGGNDDPHAFTLLSFHSARSSQERCPRQELTAAASARSTLAGAGGRNHPWTPRSQHGPAAAAATSSMLDPARANTASHR
jgi:hypothetical protein